MKEFHAALIDLAHGFAQQLLGVVKEASVADVRDALGGASTGTDAAIVALLQTRRAGMRATEIRAALGMTQARRMSRAVAPNAPSTHLAALAG